MDEGTSGLDSAGASESKSKSETETKTEGSISLYSILLISRIADNQHITNHHIDILIY